MYQRSALVICVLAIVMSGVVPVQAGLQDGLVSYFKLDEGSGTLAADASGNVHNGTLIGTNVTRAPGYDGAGYACAAPATGNVADRLEFPTAGMSLTAGTVSVWGYMTDPQPATDGRYIFGHTAQPQFNSRIQVFMQDGANVSRKLDIGMGGSHATAADVVELPLKEWFQIALTWNNGAYAVYVNGAQVNAGAYTGLTTLNTIANFGNDGSNAPYEAFCGMLDEARVYNRALTAAEVKAIYQLLPTGRILAKEPSPADKAVDVPADSVLGWTKSEFAATHDVYLAKTFADANNASRAKPASVLISQGQAATTYTPAALLEYGQTYYWRVDEVNQAPDNTIFKGNIWSFTVEPYSYPMTVLKATASSAQPSMGPEKTIDGSGLNANGQHGVEPTTMWVSAGTLPNWIQYEFDALYRLDKLLVWNSNQMVEPFIGFGAKDVTVEYSVDGTTWSTLAGAPLFAQGTGLEAYAANTTVSFGGVSAKYVKLTINKTWGAISATTGLAEVRFYSVPVQARAPQPAAGATGVPLDTELTWRPGREATSHKVYFGTDPNSVASGTAAAVTVTAHSFTPTVLSYGTKYYWKVDEIGGSGPYAGQVWSFATREYAAIDDFESYNDNDNRIYDAWLDGLVNSNGSTVGYFTAPFAERTVIHSGKQSMPFEYNNVKTPYYSEAEQTFAPVQNWTGSGADSLSLWVRGNPVRMLDKGNGAFTISGSGTDIWNAADDFRFVYKRLTGDGSILVKVDSLVNTNVWAKAGVMIRQSLEAGSPMAYMIQSAASGASFGWRLLAAGACGSMTQAGIVAPQWVKLTRKGNAFTAQYSVDGKTWTDIKNADGTVTSTTITMTGSLYLGLCVTSHDVTKTTTAEFSGAATAGGVTGEWQVAEIGVDPQPANSPDTLYVVVLDSAGKSATATNATAVTSAAWTQWKIPLSSLAGVNMSKVKKLSIGVGNRTSPKAGGAGRLYIDDIGYGHSLP